MIGRIGGNGFLTCPLGTEPVCGAAGDPIFCELKKLGIDSLGRNLVIPKPLDCCAAGAARFFVATGLKLSFRGWLIGEVEVCRPGRRGPSKSRNQRRPDHFAHDPPPCFLWLDLARYDGLIGKVAENNNCDGAVKANFLTFSAAFLAARDGNALSF